MTPVEKALIVPQCEGRFFFSLLFFYFTFLLFLCGGEEGREVSVNWLMCSIQQTLHTGSIKQESALYAGTIVPLRTAIKASYKTPPGKNSPHHHSSREPNRIGESRRNHMCNVKKTEGGGV